MRVRVYALVRGGTSVKTFRTTQGERLHVVRRGTTAAVVSDRSTPVPPTASNLRRYDRTMREIAKRFPAVLPARFGTVTDEDELTFILSSRQVALARALSRVRGRVQMTLRIITPDAANSRAGVGTRHFAGRPASGHDYLTERARDAAAARVVAGFEPVRVAVARWVKDERVERRAGVASVYHLIPRSSADAYRRAVEAAGAAAGLRLLVSGPWPAYAFGAD